MARHAQRARPCAPADQHLKCRACGGTFASRFSLNRHTGQYCNGRPPAAAPRPAAAPVDIRHTTTNNTNSNNTNNIQNNTYISLNGRPAGWPANWPAPPAELRPFAPPAFTVTLEQLQRAAAGIGECKESDSKAVADFMVDVVRQVQADPLERNIYLNPQRADQVLVLGGDARRWVVMPLQEGTLMAFNHIATELAEWTEAMAGRPQKTTKTVESGYRKNTAAVVRDSRQAMAAHLTNLGTKLLASTEDGGWLGELDGAVPGRTRDFGHERCGHVAAASLVDAVERGLGIYADRDVTDASVGRQARAALALYAKLVLYRHPENLTVFLADNDGAFVHRSPARWERVAAADAARTQVRALADHLVPYLTNHGPPPLRRVGEYLRQHAAALGDEEAASLSLLTHYSREAIRFYGEGGDEARGRARRAMVAAGLLAVGAPPPLADAGLVDALLAGAF